MIGAPGGYQVTADERGAVWAQKANPCKDFVWADAEREGEQPFAERAAVNQWFKTMSLVNEFFRRGAGPWHWSPAACSPQPPFSL